MVPAPVTLDIDSSRLWLQIGSAVLCGGAIGLERQLRGKAAGIRTSILICLGTTIFVALGDSFDASRADPGRVLGQVVTGIGFLGAGVILAREGRILGVTSAAVIWVLAALGSLIGLGYLATAFVVTLVTLVVLIGVEVLESQFAHLRQGSIEKDLAKIELER